LNHEGCQTKVQKRGNNDCNFQVLFALCDSTALQGKLSSASESEEDDGA
jgi:hypothetical protein